MGQRLSPVLFPLFSQCLPASVKDCIWFWALENPFVRASTGNLRGNWQRWFVKWRILVSNCPCLAMAARAPVCVCVCVCVLVTQSCPSLCNPMDSSPPASSIHGILQARIQEWVAISFSRGSSQPRDQTWVSYIAGRLFSVWATREAYPSHLFQAEKEDRV